MPLQVIGGEARGRRLRSPKRGVRPTAAILRRSLFDILGPRVVGANVLDLYAGAGTLGIEALSRGAAAAAFVERDRACANVIAENLALTGGEAQARVHCTPVESWIAKSRDQVGAFDLILMDPPYGDAGLKRVLTMLGADKGARQGALVVLEERSSFHLSPPPGLAEVRRVVHGDSALTMLEVAR